MRFAFGLILFSIIPIGSAQAQVTQAGAGVLDVTLRINRACEVRWPAGTANAGSALLDFGAWDRIDHNIDGQVMPGTDGSTFEVHCNPGVTYKIEFNGGENGDGSIDARAMRGSSGNAILVPYQIYSTDARAAADALGTLTVAADGTFQQIPIYGRIAQISPTPPADDYTDRVTITISF